MDPRVSDEDRGRSRGLAATPVVIGVVCLLAIIGLVVVLVWVLLSTAGGSDTRQAAATPGVRLGHESFAWSRDAVTEIPPGGQVAHAFWFAWFAFHPETILNPE